MIKLGKQSDQIHISGGRLQMENGHGEMSRKKMAAKIIAPILIVLVVAGIWFFKNSQSIAGELQVENPDFALTVTEPLDLEQLKSYGLPILLDFGSDSCPPCRRLAPTIKKLHKTLQGKAIIKYMDVWELPELAEGYPIRVIPTLLFFDKDGNPYEPSDPEASRMLIYTTKDTGEHVFTAYEGAMSEKEILSILVKMGMEE
jgi:thioredoxin 1